MIKSEDIIKRLLTFGYTDSNKHDATLIEFISQKVENHIKTSCNITSIPDELYNIAVDRVCGEFLFTKKQTGQLTIGDVDLTGAITSIKEGDVSVNFDANTSEEAMFKQMVDYLMTKGEGDFVCYRKIKW